MDDALIEQVANVIDNWILANGATETDLARAIIPIVLEEAAKVLIIHQCEVDDDNRYWGGPHKRHYDNPRDLAAAIRALGEK